MIINWGDITKICLGMMLMRPDDYWNSSPKTIFLALKGFKQFHGGNEKPQPMTRSRMEELMELSPDE